MESTFLRSNNYDLIPHTIESLRKLISTENKILKSQESNKFQTATVVNKEAQGLANMIVGMYGSLRKDWLNKAIQTSRYIGNLKPIYQFLQDHPDVKVPEEMAQEINRHHNIL